MICFHFINSVGYALIMFGDFSNAGSVVMKLLGWFSDQNVPLVRLYIQSPVKKLYITF